MSMTAEAKEPAQVCLCPATDPGATPPCSPEDGCCQEPVSMEPNSPLCFPLGIAFKKFPRACIWHKLRCYSKFQDSSKPKPHIYSVWVYWSWLLCGLLGAQMKHQAASYGQRGLVSYHLDKEIYSHWGRGDSSRCIIQIQYFYHLLNMKWLYSLRTKWWWQ